MVPEREELYSVALGSWPQTAVPSNLEAMPIAGAQPGRVDVHNPRTVFPRLSLALF